MEAEEIVMSQQAEYYGLCSTCNHAPGCPSAQDPNNPVLYCEEFDDYEPPAPRSARRKTLAPAAPSTMEAVSPDRPMGLCATCENCQSCAFAEPEGGVWHCEEYR
jgi:hypothetical protein